jgi:hypothetical protein
MKENLSSSVCNKALQLELELEYNKTVEKSRQTNCQVFDFNSFKKKKEDNKYMDKVDKLVAHLKK